MAATPSQGGGSAPPAAPTASPWNVYRAEDYGARSTLEKADSSGPINLAAVIASRLGGGTVQLDAGKTYGARFTVTIPANVELVIPTGSTLQAAAGLQGDLVSIAAGSGGRISGGGTVDANRAASGMTGNGVSLNGCIEAAVEEVSVINAYLDDVALVNCSRCVLDVFAGASGRHGVYHSGTTFCRGQVTARDNGQRVAGSGVVFDAASTDNCYAPLVATDSRAGGAKTQQYGVLEVPASGCDRNVFGATSLGGNAVGTMSLVGGSSGVQAGVPLAGSVTDASIAAAGLSNSSLNSTVARANQLVNGGFEIWQRGTAFNANSAYTADRWQLSFAVGSPASVGVTRIASTVGSSGYSAQFVNTPNAGSQVVLVQPIPNTEFPQLQGKTVTFAVTVKANAVGVVRVSVFDPINGHRFGAYNALANPAAGEVISVTAPIAVGGAAQQSVCVWQDTAAAATVEINDAVLVVGTVAPAYVPLTPADDLARCERYYQRFPQAASSGGYTGIGMCISGTQAFVVIALSRTMGGSPSVTISAASDWGVLMVSTAVQTCSSLASQSADQHAITVYPQLAAANLVGGNATILLPVTGAAWIAAEWNP